MTAVERRGRTATLFVTNVLNGTVASGETPIDEGTVVRIRLHTAPAPRAGASRTMQVIAERLPRAHRPGRARGRPHRRGPRRGRHAVRGRHAGQPHRRDPERARPRRRPLGGGGRTVAAGGYLNNPLGLTIAPNGDILTANADDGNIVETTPVGAEFQPLDTGAGDGGLFGLTVTPNLRGRLLRRRRRQHARPAALRPGPAGCGRCGGHAPPTSPAARSRTPPPPGRL